jgi:hypothetical protein
MFKSVESKVERINELEVNEVDCDDVNNDVDKIELALSVVESETVVSLDSMVVAASTVVDSSVITELASTTVGSTPISDASTIESEVTVNELAVVPISAAVVSGI